MSYKNYLYVLFKMYTKRKVSRQQNVNIKIVTRNNENFFIPYGWAKAYAMMNTLHSKNNNKEVSELNISKEGISFKYMGNSIIIDPARFSDPYAVFFNEEYNYLRVKGKVVIDIGANIGDSSIYFALRGADIVYGFEPYPYAFAYALKNVSSNNLRNIILFNAGYGRDSNVLIDSEKISSNESSLVHSSKGKEINIFSLKTILTNHNISSAIIKMDCEGCEYALLDEDDEVFNYIEMIQIEYHYGYDKLKEKLERVGFKVKYTEPKEIYNREAKNQNMRVGYIYAERNPL